ncbi:hypothetical protein CKM354_001142400 [Cercospora kikuchii]|uniref:F-box domain-containing protein n=1 Tax=Cercospora kikuchii TaxID=84275 RepID=A0A9P3FL95_9PEZI|nr:uncharacterized protein CKM354_001142400 [Cercospora kikuchii]GIZ48360.1 hypothetical protein CKM354_001142400 [Cercospora kikuchii]
MCCVGRAAEGEVQVHAHAHALAQRAVFTATAALQYQVSVRWEKKLSLGERIQDYTACHEALAIVEILEPVLLYLPIRYLLLAQGVSKFWREVIDGSQSIQKALFFFPVLDEPLCYMDWEFDDKRYYHPFWHLTKNPERNWPICGEYGTETYVQYRAHWGQTRQDVYKYRVFVNPLLAELFPILSPRGTWNSLVDPPSGMMNREASWRRMYLTQPPVAQLFIKSNRSDRLWEYTTLDTFSQSIFCGLRGRELWGRLGHESRRMWINGVMDWQEYKGADDLKRVVRKEGEQGRLCS